MIIMAVDDNGVAYPLEVDASRRLKVLVDALTGTLSVSIDAQGITPNVNVANNRKTTYNAQSLSVINFALTAGKNTIDFAAVPTGEDWIMKWYSFAYVGTVTNVRVRAQPIVGGTEVYMNDHATLISGRAYGYACDIPMNAGDKMRMAVFNATLNDDFYGYAIFERVN